MLVADPWAWGWDALVAIGTLTLAGVTVVVAGFTWRLASKTSALAEKTSDLAASTQADVAAQFRPVVTAAQFRSATQGRGSDPSIWPLLWADEHVATGGWICALTNIGHGPALRLSVRAKSSSQTPDVGTSVLAVDCPAEAVTIYGPISSNVDGGFTITVQYDSVAGERYESEITFRQRRAGIYLPDLTRVERTTRLGAAELSADGARSDDAAS
jgi:hypothetical protein